MMNRTALLCAAMVVSVSASADEAQCLNVYGKTMCGFSCAADYGQVNCAKTPLGACIAAYGHVVCWDPQFVSADAAGPKGECKAAFGKIACGYGCIAEYGVVRCAQRPFGTCGAAGGKVVCSDDPRN